MKIITEIIKKPIITEKSLKGVERGFYAFVVDVKAGKREIARAVEKQFGVNVTSVRTLIVKGKIKQRGKKKLKFKLTSWKKAIVGLKPGEKIGLFETTS